MIDYEQKARTGHYIRERNELIIKLVEGELGI
jgi:hypothetical protein